MATLADLEVTQMKDHLTTGGFFSPFTDILGDSQPAPIFQGFELNLIPDGNNVDAIKPNDRVIMIRESGNITNLSTRPFWKDKPMLILIAGKVAQTDRMIIKGIADDIDAYLVENFQDNGCIANIVSSGVVGPFGTGNDRRYFEINITVMFNFDA